MGWATNLLLNFGSWICSGDCGSGKPEWLWLKQAEMGNDVEREQLLVMIVLARGVRKKPYEAIPH